MSTIVNRILHALDNASRELGGKPALVMISGAAHRTLIEEMAEANYPYRYEMRPSAADYLIPFNLEGHDFERVEGVVNPGQFEDVRVVPR
jgi:hypothetical protein